MRAPQSGATACRYGLAGYQLRLVGHEMAGRSAESAIPPTTIGFQRAADSTAHRLRGQDAGGIDTSPRAQ
jgi:hypothetical protein